MINPKHLFVYALCLAGVMLSSCKKIETPVFEFAYLRVINASPTFATYNVYQNTNKFNTVPLPFGGTVNYQQSSIGTKTIKFTTGSDTQSLLDKEISLTNGKAYSLYLVDQTNKLDALLVTDEMEQPVVTKAYVKFINLSPDAPLLNLDVKDGANLVKDKAYKVPTSGFMAIDPKTYNFEIKNASNGAVQASLNDTELVAGRYYTIIAKGLLNPGANELGFGAQIIINN